MTDLLKRLQSATEGSASLDKEIGLAVFPNAGNNYIQRPYSQSIDAALTLVRDEEQWEVRSLRKKGVFVASVAEMRHEYSGVGRAATPALALCIAAIKRLGAGWHPGQAYGSV